MLFRLHFYILFFCLVFVTATYAQDKNKTVALKTILESIEKQHHVSFNYLENDIISSKIVPPKKSLSLDMKISYLQKKTPLQFHKLDETFYTISSQKETEFVCGYLFNKSDNSPIAGVNIVSSNGTHTLTSENGYFEIKGGISNSITVSHIGYAAQKISLQKQSSTNCLKIYLEMKLYIWTV